MVYGVLTLIVKVWLCGMTRAYADPKASSSKFRPKIVGIYASIYGRSKMLNILTCNKQNNTRQHVQSDTPVLYFVMLLRDEMIGLQSANTTCLYK